MASIDEFLKKYSSLSKSASDDKDKDDKKDEKKEKSEKEKEDEKKKEKEKEKKDEDDKEKSASDNLQEIYGRAVNGGLDQKSLNDLNSLALIEAMNIKTASEMMNKSANAELAGIGLRTAEEARDLLARESKGIGNAAARVGDVLGINALLGRGKDKVVAGAKYFDEGAMGLGRRMNPGVAASPSHTYKAESEVPGLFDIEYKAPREAQPISDNHARALGYGVPAGVIGGLGTAVGFAIKHISDAKKAQSLARVAQEAQAATQTAAHEAASQMGYMQSFGNKAQGMYNSAIDTVKAGIGQAKDFVSENKYPLMAAGGAIAGGIGAYELMKKDKEASMEKLASTYVESVWNDLMTVNLAKEANNYENFVISKEASLEKSANVYVESVWNDLMTVNLAKEAQNYENFVMSKGVK